MKPEAELVPPGGGEWALGGRHQIKVRGDRTGGRFAFWTTPTVFGDGPPLHLHRHDEEIFFVLAGAYDILIDERWRRLEIGEAIQLPRDRPHRYRGAASSATSWALQMVLPSGLEEYFRLIGDASPATRDGMALRRRVGRSYGLDFPESGELLAPPRVGRHSPWVGNGARPPAIHAGTVVSKRLLEAAPEGGADIDAFELGAAGFREGVAPPAGGVLFGCGGHTSVRCNSTVLDLTPGGTVYLAPGAPFVAVASEPSRILVFSAREVAAPVR